MTDAQTIIDAKYPEDIFGEQSYYVTSEYRKLATIYHPDNKTTGHEEAFKALNALKRVADQTIKDCTYGQRKQTARPVLITTRRHAYTVERLIHKGNTAVIYTATYPNENGDTQNATLKVVRNPREGQKLADEAKALKTMLKTDPEMFDLISPYLPAYIEAFGYKAGGKTRQAIAYRAEYPVVSLEDVRRVYPDGVHPKDSAWMLRRLFMVLGLVHASGWVHHDVKERHIMIQPEEHGLMLVDWTTAEQVLPANSKIAGHDLADGIRSVANITAMRLAPARYRRFIEGCQRYPARLPDAFSLKDEYDELIEDLWGPRKFRPFAMPVPISNR